LLPAVLFFSKDTLIDVSASFFNFELRVPDLVPRTAPTVPFTPPDGKVVSHHGAMHVPLLTKSKDRDCSYKTKIPNWGHLYKKHVSTVWTCEYLECYEINLLTD
jgi:hypothetical protein